MKIGERIGELRRSKNLSQGDIGGKTGMERGYLSKIETGRLLNPTFLTLRSIKRALKVSWKELLVGVDE
jgi:transcriptional regulator with XRE-family HTH domain